MALNCREFKECGRQPGGRRVAELGVCPATTAIHVTGTFAQKQATCLSCELYRKVKETGAPPG